MYPKRKRAVAKFKQQFTPSDENLSTELKEREKKLSPIQENDITDFIKYNSRRYINNLVMKNKEYTYNFPLFFFSKTFFSIPFSKLNRV